MGFTISNPPFRRSTTATVTNRVNASSSTTSMLEAAISSDSVSRMVVTPAWIEAGAGGASARDSIMARLPPVGTNTNGTWGAFGPGFSSRRFDRLGWLNVRDYGAAGDGTTDDGAAIEAAMAVAPTTGTATVVYFPPGVYLTSIGVRPRSGTTVRGAGMGVSIVKAAPSMNNVTLFQNEHGGNLETGDDNIAVYDMTFDGNVANRPGWTVGHVFNFGATDGTTCDNITVRNVEQLNGLGAGCVFVNCVNLIVDGCHIHNNGRDGMYLQYSCQNCRVSNNYIHDVGDDMIGLNAELSASTGHTFRNVTVTGNTLGPSNPSSANQGIILRGGQRVSIVGNTVLNGNEAGIALVSHNTSAVTDVVVAGNVITGSGAAGGVGDAILLSSDNLGGGGPANFSYVTVTNNVVENAARNGIGFWTPDGGTLFDINISNNVLRGKGAAGGSASADGIQITPSASTTITRLVINNNIIDSWARYGVNIVPNGNIRQVTLNGNMVSSNGKQTAASGIRISSGQIYTINGNNCCDVPTATQTYGIEYANLTNSVVTSNVVSGNVTGGVNATGTNTNTTAANNQT